MSGEGLLERRTAGCLFNRLRDRVDIVFMGVTSLQSRPTAICSTAIACIRQDPGHATIKIKLFKGVSGFLVGRGGGA
jgi:hypothetical protein